jgi:hypothetical protein
MIIMPPSAEAHFVLYCHYIIKLSVKQEKHSTRTLSLVILRVRFKIKPAKKTYMSIQGGMKPRKP